MTSCGALLFSALVVLLASGCSQLGHLNDDLYAPASIFDSPAASSSTGKPAHSPVQSVHPVSPARRDIQQSLDAQYQQWRGVPYREGGYSRHGIDCSAFVQLTFQNRFGRHLPRSTQEQSRVGRTKSRQDLQPGDLVFFKTGFKTRHVGIYLGNGRFIHASTSRGVTQSSLQNPYWEKSFWMAREVL